MWRTKQSYKTHSPAPEYVIDFTALGGTNLTANCTAYGDANIVPPDVRTCPASIILWGRRSTLLCQWPFQCLTVPVETEMLRRYGIAMGFIGFIECALVCVLAAINPRLRKWPGTDAARDRLSVTPRTVGDSARSRPVHHRLGLHHALLR